jgi:carboxyl-terminal processing protease
MRPRRSAAAARVLATVVLLLPFCCTGLRPAGAEERAPAVHAEPQWDWKTAELAKLFDAVVETIDQKFFDEALLKRLDWPARAQALRPSVLSAPDTQVAARLINALLSELKTSHTALYTPDEYLYYILLDILRGDGESADLVARRFWGSGPYYPGIGAFTRQVEDRHFVDGILEGSPADRAGLKYGDEILAVDGMPYSPIAAFRGKIGTMVELEIRRRSNAAPRRLQVSVNPIRPAVAFAAATQASARVIEREGRRIGYVHIWSSNEPTAFKNALVKLEPQSIVQDRLRQKGVSVIPNTLSGADLQLPKPLDFLIVDMRGRVGGNIGVAGQYLELLDARDKPYWGSERSIQRSDARVRIDPGSPKNPPFRGRSALLIDHHTRSAAELMAHGYKRNAFGPVVGTPTAGTVSSGGLFLMPGDLLLYVATSSAEFDGQRLEGVGVSPDHRVERPLPYAAGADPVLDAAVELLSKQAAK